MSHLQKKACAWQQPAFGYVAIFSAYLYAHLHKKKQPGKANQPIVFCIQFEFTCASLKLISLLEVQALRGALRTFCLVFLVPFISYYFFSYFWNYNQKTAVRKGEVVVFYSMSSVWWRFQWSRVDAPLLLNRLRLFVDGSWRGASVRGIISVYMSTAKPQNRERRHIKMNNTCQSCTWQLLGEIRF